LKIRDYVQVIAQPTVVRLDHLGQANPGWITDSYYITEESQKYFKALKTLLSRDRGCGLFLIGHYGSGKSHFLAYLAQQLHSGAFVPRAPAVVPLSLLNYRAQLPLESIVGEVLGLEVRESDRRKVWKRVLEQHKSGIFLIVDELSEFLRSKPALHSFNEDLRFLQFLGEWAADHPLWVLAALQEQIEHTGDIEYDLYRKIKDRYPARFLLTPAHVKDLIAHRILHKKSGYAEAVEALTKELKAIYGDTGLNYADLCEIYPLHPSTMEILEEVRDRFSQARGIVDFTLTRMLGNEATGVAPFLDQPWGQVITPDAIVDHFSDLFEVQPEFLPIAQKVLPHFRKCLPGVFEKTPQQELAWRLLKLLILVHLSPRRKWLSVEQAAQWLLIKVSSVDPEKNRQVVRRILDALVEQGSFLRKQSNRYRLDLEDSGRDDLDQLLSKTVEEIRGRGDSVFESMVGSLDGAEFNPCAFPRDRWHMRKIRWRFHERELQVYFGAGTPPPQKDFALQIGLPWGPPAEGARCFQVQPRRLELSQEVLELAALYQLSERPLPVRVGERIKELITSRSAWFRSLVRAAYAEATILDAAGAKLTPPPIPVERHGSWLNALGEWMLRQTYPLFEKFAPGHGPLSKEVYRQFMKYASEHDLGAEQAPEVVKLIREGYLVPMGLMQRHGAEYHMSPRLDNHELVRLLAPMIEHHPAPERVYQHLSAPPYGLVEDQVQLLLITLLIQGEIDIVKGDHSYRDYFETLVNPLQYDRVLPGHALVLSQIRDLEMMCQSFRIPIPRQWTVLAQRRAVNQLAKQGNRVRSQLVDLLMKLKTEPDTQELQAQLEKLISQWQALEKGKNELQGFQHFLFEIGAPARFAAESAAAASLLDRYDQMMRETRRFRHLFGYPCLAQCPDAGIATALDALGEPPSPARPDELRAWLESAQALYRKYQEWYRSRHEQWRNAANEHPIWSYPIPALARARHLNMGALAADLESVMARARTERCPGLAALDFQPLCRCAFDGQESPLEETLRRFEELSRRLEQEMALFFQQDKVKSRVQEWVEQKLELNTRTLSYLEGEAGYPEVQNIALFDQHLAGLELVKPVKAEALLEFIGERTWERSALLKALEQFFERMGPRIMLRKDDPAPRKDLVAWCCEQALMHGCPMPPGLWAPELALIAETIQPRWVGEQSLLSLERLGLPDEAADRIIEMLLDGAIRAPQASPQAGPLAAALELLTPQQLLSAAELAGKTAALYEQNERFMRLRPGPWLARLHALAETKLQQMPGALDETLRSNMDAQWVVIDCLGLPLLRAASETVASCLARWRVAKLDYAVLPPVTSTDSFYRSLLRGGINKSFAKIDAVDALIHGRKLGFSALEKLARAELEIAFKALSAKLDPARPLLIFGDHGFRLALDGIGFIHGGPSTLERITPVFALSANG